MDSDQLREWRDFKLMKAWLFPQAQTGQPLQVGLHSGGHLLHLPNIWGGFETTLLSALLNSDQGSSCPQFPDFFSGIPDGSLLSSLLDWFQIDRDQNRTASFAHPGREEARFPRTRTWWHHRDKLVELLMKSPINHFPWRVPIGQWSDLI